MSAPTLRALRLPILGLIPVSVRCAASTIFSVNMLGHALAGVLLSGGRPANAQCEVHENAKLTASDAADQDHFGYSVSLSGDQALVGVYGDDCPLGGPECGSAHLYRYDGANWYLQQKLTAFDAVGSDRYGWSVSLSGKTAIVGVPLDNCPYPFGGLNYCGSVYVYGYREGLATWVQEQKLSASDAAQGGEFGFSVSLSDTKAIVGGLGFHTFPDTFYYGSAYVYRKLDRFLFQEQKLYASDQALDDYFGESVSLSGNWAIVGARGAQCTPQGGSKCGAAYIYHYDGTTWVEQQKLSAAPVGGFGNSVCISGDRAIVGAFGTGCPAGSAPGSAYIYHYDGTNWIEEQRLTACDRPAYGYFGSSVSLSGDRAMMGGLVYRYDGTSWVEEQRLTASDAGQAAIFGSSVSLDGRRALVGASGVDCPAGIDCGSAYVFDFESVPFPADCNANKVSDECDISHELSPDCNSNGVPDECEVPPICTTCVDCNTNGIPDECDIANCAGDPVCADCNYNAIPDACDIAACRDDANCADCNANGIPDECDLANCTGDPACADRNHNLVPDGCESGTCCDHDPFGVGCTDSLFQKECNCPRCEWTELASCDYVDCPLDSIPTVSSWGLAILALLLLIGAKIRFGGRWNSRAVV